jgi:GTP cyclohydrolase II
VHGPFDVDPFLNLHTRAPVVVLGRGDVLGPEPLLARVHSSCVTSEAFGGRDCDCAEQLDAALEAIAREGRGVVFYLMQEGRGAGFAAKARDRMLVQASRHRLTTFEAYAQMGLERDHRRYDEVAFACRMLNLSAPLILLTNNPEKKAELEREGVRLAGTRPLERAASPWSRHYLDSKARSGHSLAESGPGCGTAELPEAVEVFDPRPVESAPRFVHVASYLLPVRVSESGDATWLRLNAVHDVVTGRELVVFLHRARAGAVPLLHVQSESLLERFPLRDGGVHRPAWREAVRAMRERGAGCALFLPPEPLAPDAAGAPAVADDEALADLLAHFLKGSPAEPFRAERPGLARLLPLLAARGVKLEPAGAPGGA